MVLRIFATHCKPLMGNFIFSHLWLHHTYGKIPSSFLIPILNSSFIQISVLSIETRPLDFWETRKILHQETCHIHATKAKGTLNPISHLIPVKLDHKIWKNLPLEIWCYSVTSNFKWKIFLNFVAFSENPNFTENVNSMQIFPYKRKGIHLQT